MVHLPEIITDLAMILLVAGITTIIFKKYNQPLILGYIIAGFITGPHFKLFPTVTDTTNITTWSEIGVIFLLFALGLEFSFYKLKSVGPTAGIAALINMSGLLVVGYFCGQLLGWNSIESIFLGGMMSLASTMIIIKAFEDLKLKGKYFTEVVFGILVIEDIVGIVMLVMVSTFGAMSGDFSALTLAGSILRLGFFLVLWFVLGMYLVPTFFKYAQKFMNDETLLISSIGLCLGMVVLGTSMGFSSALGAFMMGSLIAEAPNSHKIEELVKPVKDLFGAIFFVSVGMLVDPQLLLDYAVPVICIFIANFISKFIFGTTGVVAAGKKLDTALLCSFSLMPLGEFSFILASLGVSVGLISPHLYSIIVAVSVLTTVTAPSFIKLATPVHSMLDKILPNSIKQKLQKYTESNTEDSDDEWKVFLQNYITRLIIFVTFLIAIAFGCLYYVHPFINEFVQEPYVSWATAIISFVIMTPFLRALLINKNARPELFTLLWLKRKANHFPLIVLVVFKILIVAYFVYFNFTSIANIPSVIAIIATVGALYFIYSSDWLLGEYLKMESRFLVNLNERHMLEHRKQLEKSGKEYTFGWFDEELFIAEYELKENSYMVNTPLSKLPFRDKYGCNILQIKRFEKMIDLPGGAFSLEANDILLLIGSKQQLEAISMGENNLGISANGLRLTLRDYLLTKQQKEHEFISYSIEIDKESLLLNKSIKDTNIRARWNCLVIGIERGGYTETNPNVSMILNNGDLLWVLGKQKMINKLVRDGMI